MHYPEPQQAHKLEEESSGVNFVSVVLGFIILEGVVLSLPSVSHAFY